MTTELSFEKGKKIVYKLRISGMRENEYVPLTQKEGDTIKKIIFNGKVKFIELSAGHIINVNMISSMQKIINNYS